MAGTTGLEPATSAVTECKHYKNHRLTDYSAAFQEAVSLLESVGRRNCTLLYFVVRLLPVSLQLTVPSPEGRQFSIVFHRVK